jgi:hypothetical protein
MKSVRFVPFLSVTALLLTALACDMEPVGSAEATREQARLAAASVPVPSAPKGVFVNAINLPDLDDDQAAIDQYILTASNCAGGNLIVPWSKVSSAPGQYNWNYVIQTAQKWRNAGKKVNLLFWGCAERKLQQFSSPGQTNNQNMTPAYIFNSPGQRSIQNVGQDGEVVRIPVFWDAPYRDNFRALMLAALDRFKDESWAGYIRFGIGVGAESYPANNLDDNANYDKWVAVDYLNKWKPYVGATLDYFGQIDRSNNRPQKKPLFVTINQSRGISDLQGLIADKCKANKFGLGTQGLAKGAVEKDAGLNGGPTTCYASWCSIFDRTDIRGAIPLEGQTTGQSSPSDGNKVGALGNIVTLAFANGIQVLELYPREWFIAYNPNDPLYDDGPQGNDYGTQYRRILDDAAAQLR